MKSYIFFMHFEPVEYFVPRLPPGLVIFQNYIFCFFSLPYPPSASSSLPSEIGRRFIGVITGRHSHLSLVGNLPLSPFPFPLSLSWWCRKGRTRANHMRCCCRCRRMSNSHSHWRRRRQKHQCRERHRGGAVGRSTRASSPLGRG